MFEKPRLYPIRDVGAPLRSLGNYSLGLGLCLLLLVGLRLYPIATPKAGALGEGTRVAVSVEDDVLASRHDLEVGEEPSLQRPTNAVKPESGAKSPAPPATRLVIPALGLDTPVVEVPITDKTWDVSALTYEIAHLGGTASPGEKSNMVLAGHVSLTRGAGPFSHLESLEPGDLAIVYAGEQAHTYHVVSKRQVGPADLSVVHSTSHPVLTLVTCTNWDFRSRTYTQRVAVIAELVEEGTS